MESDRQKTRFKLFLCILRTRRRMAADTMRKKDRKQPVVRRKCVLIDFHQDDERKSEERVDKEKQFAHEVPVAYDITVFSSPICNFPPPIF